MSADRPRTRGDCTDGPRPCPWVSCRHHLALDVNEHTGQVRIVIPVEALDQAEHTCALDVAEHGGLGDAAVARLLGLGQSSVSKVSSRGEGRLLRLPVIQELGQ